MNASCRLGRMAAIAACMMALSSCANKLPETLQLPSIPGERDAQKQKFLDTEPLAISRVPVRAGSFVPSRVDDPLSAEMGAKAVDLMMPAGATMADLAFALSTGGVALAFASEGVEGKTVEALRLPFTSYHGDLKGLLSMLENAAGIVASEREGVVYLGDTARYTVSLPQNADVLDAVAGEIAGLGATDVIKSVHGGQIIYTARPGENRRRIRPFLKRVSDNLAVVNLQVAVVSLAINDTTNQGFNWNAFKVKLDSRDQSTSDPSQTAAATPDIPDGQNGGQNSGDTGVPGIGDIMSPGTLIDLSSGGVSVAHTAAGQIFGRAGLATFAGAIDFLSTFGETRVGQNVDLRTISGQQVTLRSGQQVPYIRNIKSNVTDSGTTSGGTETDTIETGLTVQMQPWFDATTELVTLDLEVTIRQILQFVELKAGDTVGSITQPLTQDQSLNDLIRIKAGETIVVGGLQNENEALTGSEPSFLRNRKKSYGSRGQNVTRNAFFVIVRPTITIFDQRDGGAR